MNVHEMKKEEKEAKLQEFASILSNTNLTMTLTTQLIHSLKDAAKGVNSVELFFNKNFFDLETLSMDIPKLFAIIETIQNQCGFVFSAVDQIFPHLHWIPASHQTPKCYFPGVVGEVYSPMRSDSKFYVPSYSGEQISLNASEEETDLPTYIKTLHEKKPQKKFLVLHFDADSEIQVKPHPMSDITTLEHMKKLFFPITDDFNLQDNTIQAACHRSYGDKPRDVNHLLLSNMLNVDPSILETVEYIHCCFTPSLETLTNDQSHQFFLDQPEIREHLENKTDGIKFAWVKNILPNFTDFGVFACPDILIIDLEHENRILFRNNYYQFLLDVYEPIMQFPHFLRTLGSKFATLKERSEEGKKLFSNLQKKVLTNSCLIPYPNSISFPVPIEKRVVWGKSLLKKYKLDVVVKPFSPEDIEQEDSEEMQTGPDGSLMLSQKQFAALFSKISGGKPLPAELQTAEDDATKSTTSLGKQKEITVRVKGIPYDVAVFEQPNDIPSKKWEAFTESERHEILEQFWGTKGQDHPFINISFPIVAELGPDANKDSIESPTIKHKDAVVVKGECCPSEAQNLHDLLFGFFKRKVSDIEFKIHWLEDADFFDKLQRKKQFESNKPALPNCATM